MEKNPEKVGPWYEKAMHVRRMSDSLYVFVGDLKAKINESSQEDLEAASHVMFAPSTGKGKELAKSISTYKSEILAQIEDPVQKKIITDNFTLNIPRLFEGTPVAAAVTLLTKLQSDIRYAEGEVLHTLTKDIDVRDVRVNQVNAYVIPSSQWKIECPDYSCSGRYHSASCRIYRRKATAGRSARMVRNGL